MGHVEKLVEVAQNQPLVQQQVTQELTKHELRQENSQVQKIDASEAGRKVKDKEREERRRERQAAARRARAGHDPPPGSDEDALPSESTEPWVGHLVNLKI